MCAGLGGVVTKVLIVHAHHHQNLQVITLLIVDNFCVGIYWIWVQFSSLHPSNHHYKFNAKFVIIMFLNNWEELRPWGPFGNCLRPSNHLRPNFFCTYLKKKNVNNTLFDVFFSTLFKFDWNSYGFYYFGNESHEIWHETHMI